MHMFDKPQVGAKTKATKELIDGIKDGISAEQVIQRLADEAAALAVYEAQLAHEQQQT